MHALICNSQLLVSSCLLIDFFSFLCLFVCLFFILIYLNLDTPIFGKIDVPQDPKTEGESALLSCDVKARPQPTDFVKWQRDMSVVDGEAFDSSEGRLLYHIPEIGRDDAGLYRCVADNGFGSSVSQELSLTVLCKLILH